MNTSTTSLAPQKLETFTRGQLERLAAANARGGPDTSGITERGIRGIFYNALEVYAQRVWAREIGLYVPSDTRTEKHRFLGNVPEPRKHFGGLNASPLRDLGFDVTNEDFELTIEISLHDWRRDKVANISRRVSEFAMAWEDHWNALTIDILEGSDLAYDGVAFFSASHSDGNSGTLINLLTASELGSLNVSDTNRPTKAEAAAILADMAAWFGTMKDDAGRPANQAAKDFLLLCHPKAAPGFKNAIRDQYYVQGGSNELKTLGQTFDVVEDNRLGSETVVYMFRKDGVSSKAIVLQEEVAPTLFVVGPDSEHAIMNNSVLNVAKASRAAAPGEFRHALKATMS